MTPMLARDLEDYVDPAGWWLSEKLDGVRAVWNGRALLSRNGNLLPAPASFTHALPRDTWLDGELWLGRGRFQETAAVVRRADHPGWSALRYRVFDAPKAAGGFEERLAVCWRVLQGCAVASVLPQVVCRGLADARNQCDAMTAAGGEGVCLRRPGSPYVEGRSRDLRRLKGAETDEGVVTGPCAKQLTLRWKGLEVTLGGTLPAELRATPPRVGMRVTFRYKGLFASGQPREPVFVGVRDYE